MTKYIVRFMAEMPEPGHEIYPYYIELFYTDNFRTQLIYVTLNTGRLKFENEPDDEITNIDPINEDDTTIDSEKLMTLLNEIEDRKIHSGYVKLEIELKGEYYE